jgi:hypothetical protein
MVSRKKRFQRHIYEISGAAMLKERLRAKNRRNAVFIWIPKSAGSSIYSTLNAPKLKEIKLVKYRFPNKGIVTFGHMDYAELVNKHYVSKEFDESAFKFAIVRNPYDRAISLFSYLKKREMIPQIESFLTFCRRLREDGCEPIGLYNLDGISQCNPQVRWVEKINMDFVGKLENIGDDMKFVFSELGIRERKVPHKNITAHADYQSYYCKESKTIIEDFYREDFEAFNYNFEEF